MNDCSVVIKVSDYTADKGSNSCQETKENYKIQIYVR